MSCIRQKRNGHVRLASLGIIIAWAAATAACASDADPAPVATEAPPASQFSQPENAIMVVARSEELAAGADQQASSDQHLTARKLEFWLLPPSADGSSVAPSASDPVYEDRVEAVYTDHLMADLVEADHLCNLRPADHCLVVVITYRSCQTQLGCEYHSISEVAMVKTHGDWSGVLIDNFNPSIDRQTMDTYLYETDATYAFFADRGFNELYSRVSADRSEEGWALRRTLEVALTRHTTMLSAALDGDDAVSAENQEEIGQALFDAIFGIYNAAIEAVLMPPAGLSSA